MKKLAIRIDRAYTKYQVRAKYQVRVKYPVFTIIACLSILGIWALILSCSPAPLDEDAVVAELALRQKAFGTISVPGEVDWYHFRANEVNSLLQVQCSSNALRPDEELLVTVYELDSEGNKSRLMADHALEDSHMPANITLNVYVDSPKDIYVSVRDLMDDEPSSYPYYLSIDFAQGTEGNEQFSQATSLSVDDPQGCHSDCISSVGDVDCYTFLASEDGVYQVHVDFTPFSGGTEVELSLDLFDSYGVLKEAISRGQEDIHILPYLSAGEYYILIDDYGRDDFDNSSTYEVCIASFSTDEQYDNDSQSTASLVEYQDPDRSFSIFGSLDYSKDQDWYRFSLQDIPFDGFAVLSLSFDDEGNSHAFTYQMILEDPNENIILSHNYSSGSSAYQVHLKAEEGDHFLLIQAGQGRIITQSAPYHVFLEVLDVIDPAEEVVKTLDTNTGMSTTGNDTIETADPLLSGIPSPAKIGYRGDTDWYRLEIPDTSCPQVLEVFLDTNNQSSKVDYSLSLIRDGVIKKAFDGNGEVNPAELKMSLLVPARNPATPLSYYFLVSDYQGDDGDGLIDYQIRTQVREIPGVLPPDPFIDGNLVLYYSEIREIEDEAAPRVKLESTSLVQKEYSVNTTWLQFHDPNLYLYDPNQLYDPNLSPDGSYNPSMPKVEMAEDETKITFPWISGYIDFQGDQDWFEVDLSPLSLNGNQPAASWYYDIRIDFHVGEPGSEVEYTWKFYRDRNQNRLLVDRPRDSDGFMASAGDLDTEVAPFDITIPDEGTDQSFWVGDDWEGKFYLSISDFNYVASEHPDDDWGYTGAPYYFRVTLVYHQGRSYP